MSTANPQRNPQFSTSSKSAAGMNTISSGSGAAYSAAGISAMNGVNSVNGMNSMNGTGAGVMPGFSARRDDDEVTIDLGQVLHVIVQNLFQIILAALIGALAFYFVSANLMKRVYSSTTKIYVMANEEVAKGNVDSSTLQAGMLLTQDYQQIIESRQVTESVIANLGLDMTTRELNEMMSVDVPEGTRVIGITIRADDPYMAADICDEVRQVAIKRIQQVMDMKSIEIVETANIPTTPDSPNSKKNAVIGGLIFALIAIIIVVMDSLMNNTIQTQEDIEKYLGISTLGSIPYDEAEDDNRKKKKRTFFHRLRPSKRDKA